MGDRDFAIKLTNQAIAAATDKSKPGNLQTAYQLFASACVADPTFGAGWYQYSNNNFDFKQIPAAIGGYRRALQCELDDKMKSRLLINLGWCFHLMGDTEKAYDATMEAGKIDDTLSHYWMHRSVLEGLLGNSKVSVETAENAIAAANKELIAATTDAEKAGAERQILEAKIALAFACLFDGQYKRGYELFELRFEWRLHAFLQFPYPKWVGENDKTVFLVADQGLGDTLSYARFVEAACKRCKYVHAYIQPELMRVFTYAFTHIPNLNLLPAGAPYPQADCWTTFVSLPYALGLSDAEVPATKQIKFTPDPLPTTWMTPDTKLHIGIAWAGSPLNDIDKHRNIPVTQFLDLYKVPGIQLYGLQVGERAKELHESGCVSLIRDLAPYIQDVGSTVALLQNLDLVICCESALGHIAALAGKEAWIPYSKCGKDYRIGLLGEKLMWTPKHRIFKQKVEGDWSSVFDEIVQALKDRIHGLDRAAGKASKVA